jgi:hypothetical protein
MGFRERLNAAQNRPGQPEWLPGRGRGTVILTARTSHHTTAPRWRRGSSLVALIVAWTSRDFVARSRNATGDGAATPRGGLAWPQVSGSRSPADAGKSLADDPHFVFAEVRNPPLRPVPTVGPRRRLGLLARPLL